MLTASLLSGQASGLSASGWAWKTLAADHANRIDGRRMPRYRPVVATLTLGGLRVSELCELNCEHVDLARRELRVLDAKTPAGVRRVDIHDDLQEELAAYKAARGETWEPGEPASLNARGKSWKRNAIAQHVIPPALEEANRQRLSVRRGRRSGVRRRPGRARRRHDDQPHLPLCTAATPAWRDRPAPSTGDARVRREGVLTSTEHGGGRPRRQVCPLGGTGSAASCSPRREFQTGSSTPQLRRVRMAPEPGRAGPGSGARNAACYGAVTTLLVTCWNTLWLMLAVTCPPVPSQIPLVLLRIRL